MPYTDDARPWRKLAAATLLQATVDARGDGDARKWLGSRQARTWAEALDLGERWPPEPGQLGSRSELEQRRRELQDGDRQA